MVNVNDFNNKLPEGDRLKLIFDRQKELMEKYDPIEEKSLGYSIPHGIFDLDVPRCQQRLKDFAWRVTEELAEATEALDNEEQTHFLEELIDAFHFIVELMIHSGITEKHFEVQPPGGGMFRAEEESADLGKGTWIKPDTLDHLMETSHGFQIHLIRETAYHVIESIGLAMNCLKNKPWKQTHMITDRQKYFSSMKSAFEVFCALLNYAGLDYNTATVFYFNKNDVNHFRIRSAY